MDASARIELLTAQRDRLNAEFDRTARTLHDATVALKESEGQWSRRCLEELFTLQRAMRAADAALGDEKAQAAARAARREHERFAGQREADIRAKHTALGVAQARHAAAFERVMVAQARLESVCRAAGMPLDQPTPPDEGGQEVQRG